MLAQGRSLSFKTFLEWCLVSVFQGASAVIQPARLPRARLTDPARGSLFEGGAIMILSLLLFETEFLNIVAISFTALILNELIMVALEITKWHVYQAVSLVVTLFLYAGSMVFLPEYFSQSRPGPASIAGCLR